MTILVIAEHNNKELAAASLNCVAAALEIAKHSASDIDILVAGSDCDEVVQACSSINGIARVLSADSAALKDHLAENMATQVVALASAYSHVLAPATTFGKNFMPRAAALLDVSQISEISEVVSADTFVRPIYAGNALAKVQSADALKVITVRTTSFPVAETGAGSASVESVEAVADSGLSTFVERQLSASERPELTSAKIIISGGRGMKDGKNFDLLYALADKLGAAVGASRAAVDAGYVPNDYQVGQTGKVVAPDLYVAVGISGAIQHQAGMKESKVIVAINTDSEAPIFQIADYGLVVDLFEAVPAMTEALS
jgi:electron transfer flavoprotein alpha subunit